MFLKTCKKIITSVSLIVVWVSFCLPHPLASDTQRVTAGNFGLPGVVDLPTALRLPDGELVVMQQLHKSLARSGISFQALPRLGVSFRYTGHGNNGTEAYGRHNHDRSFDAHISVLDGGTYLPAISLGMRDFIGTGFYSSEYIVGTKSIGSLELSGARIWSPCRKKPFPTHLALCHRFDQREGKSSHGRWNVAWFRRFKLLFMVVQYHINDKITLIGVHFRPHVARESWYRESGNFASYQRNTNLSAQYLHGSQVSPQGLSGLSPLVGGTGSQTRILRGFCLSMIAMKPSLKSFEGRPL